MARVIEFRGWNSQTKNMLTMAQLLRTDPDTYSCVLRDCLNGFKAIVTLEQFTGLHDKNGVKIFENDLLLVKVELAEKYISESIFSCQINRMGAPEFNFKCLQWEDGAKNQIPVNTTLCEKYGTLDCDYRGEKYDRIAIPEQWGTNHFHSTKWKQSEYTADIEIIGNIHQNPELLEKK